jgi:hypothetical protein
MVTYKKKVEMIVLTLFITVSASFSTLLEYLRSYRAIDE